MTVQDKIQEAERWLQKIKNAYPHDQIGVQDNTNAFLEVVNSVPDHLLEDYNEKYKLGISMTQELYSKIFENEAKKTE